VSLIKLVFSFYSVTNLVENFGTFLSAILLSRYADTSVTEISELPPETSDYLLD